MNPLTSNQMTKYLAATSILYSDAKLYKWSRIGLAAATAVGFPLASLLLPALGNIKSITSGVVAVGIFGLLWMENRKSKTAAIIQDHLDRMINHAPSNDFLIGQLPIEEDINLLASRSRIQRNVSDWYSRSATTNQQAILNLRENFVFDSRLRRYYLIWVIVTLSLTLSIHTGIGYYSTEPVAKFIDGIIFPSMPWYLILTKEIIDCANARDTCETASIRIKQKTSEHSEITPDLVRCVLDVLYVHRKSSPLIPDSLYSLHAKNINKYIQATSE